MLNSDLLNPLVRWPEVPRYPMIHLTYTKSKKSKATPYFLKYLLN